MVSVQRLEPCPDESLNSYLQRAARHQFFGDPVAFLRAGGIDWPDRARDLDLLSGQLVEQVAALLELDADRAVRMTVHPLLNRLPDECRGSLRRWIHLVHRMRACDRCVAEQPYGRIYWRIPLITECLSHHRPLLDQCRVCGAVRDRTSRRWERFDCGHRVDRSAGVDSVAIDLRIQQAVQFALGVRVDRSHEACPWLVGTLNGHVSKTVEVDFVRESLRDVWTSIRRNRVTVHRLAGVLQVLIDRGERMYPTQRSGPVAPAAADGCSPEALCELADSFPLRKPSVTAPDDSPQRFQPESL